MQSDEFDAAPTAYYPAQVGLFFGLNHRCCFEVRRCSGENQSQGFVNLAQIDIGIIGDNNIVCVGTNSEDMAVAINWIIAKGGGQVVVRDGEVIESLELPIGGIVADIDPAEMAECEIRLDDAARDLGCDVPWPFMYMFVLSITAIPDMAMTDLGVVDCVGLKIVEPVLGAA